MLDVKDRMSQPRRRGPITLLCDLYRSPDRVPIILIALLGYLLFLLYASLWALQPPPHRM